MQKAKETASDIAASAKAGMEKARATVGGKTEKWTTGDPARKEMAEAKKDERIREADREKHGAYDQNAAARMTGAGFTTGGDEGYTGHGGGAGNYSAMGGVNPAGVVDTRARGTGVLDSDVGGEGLMDDDDFNRPGRGTGGTGRGGFGTGTGATY